MSKKTLFLATILTLILSIGASLIQIIHEAGAEVILENDWCANQAFAMDNILALQCHVEMTAPMVSEWASLYEDELREPSASVQSAAGMTTDLEARVSAMQAVADRLYRRWLRPVIG